MPEIVVFHVGDAVAGNGVGDDDRRFFGDPMGSLDSGYKVADRVSGAPHHVEVKALEFCGERFQRHDLFSGAVDLDVVTVDDEGEGRYRRVPRLAKSQSPAVPMSSQRQEGVRVQGGLAEVSQIYAGS
ncbi:MAG: hypothetical protein UY76_C0027G0004 [Candidatus Uhrbacteria bacterium GW2011_GWA2_52_8d]|uniref:Uncharacterized protein n=1 Tax=Candidatus Uhrbacteria bacterium GW2011_GWA2_52_8d TaxID=1618979 RepID=A0A0G1ZVS8_9BACT|nr:MAG: hypothetical protein UY76_C0027G0004 [Candidatus Uhrbacteria bacterium GW2011_GWA2_52_8d]